MKKIGLVAILIVAAAATVGLARHRMAPRPDATLTYYFIPGCSTCAHTAARLREAVAPYGDRVTMRLVENRSDEGRIAARDYHFLSHGVVLNDRAGVAQLVESDHRVFPEHVVSALERVLPATK